MARHPTSDKPEAPDREGENGDPGRRLAGRSASDVVAPPPSGRGAVDHFLGEAKRFAPSAQNGRGRMIFALDATMSRQPTWDLACKLQARMFESAAAIGGLDVQLVYFRGFSECRSSDFVADARRLTELMASIDCRGGQTQIERILKHARAATRRARVNALVFVGDAMEEAVDPLCRLAGELGLLGVKAFLFQEGHDAVAEAAFREIARLTGGAYARFDASAPGELEALLRAAAAFAAGGRAALEDLAKREGAGALKLLGQIGRS